MHLNLFSDSKYYKFNELYKRYHEELYNYLKDHKFILSNEHYLTHWSKQATIAITMFESSVIIFNSSVILFSKTFFCLS